MKKIFILLVILISVSQLKAQSLFQTDPALSPQVTMRTSPSNRSADNSLLTPLAALPKTTTTAWPGMNPANPFYTKMPVVKMSRSADKMPVMDLNKADVKAMILVKRYKAVNMDTVRVNP